LTGGQDLTTLPPPRGLTGEQVDNPLNRQDLVVNDRYEPRIAAATARGLGRDKRN